MWGFLSVEPSRNLQLIDQQTPRMIPLFCTEHFDECMPNSVVYVFGGYEDICTYDEVETRGWRKL
jgi:hypothetical protein